MDGEPLSPESKSGQRARRKRLTWSWVLPVGVLLLGLIAWLLFDFMPVSTPRLENRAEGKPGVLSAAAAEAEGDGLPFPMMRAAKSVEITMKSDSTAREINDVLHSYDRDIDDGDVGSIDLVLVGSKPGSLLLGEEIYASDAAVDELVDAIKDPEIIGYYREAYPVLPSATVDITPGRFDRVLRFADRFGQVEPTEYVSIESGGFVLSRDEQFGERHAARLAARESVVAALDARFGLAGALVDGRGPLKLSVEASERTAVERFVSDSPLRPEIGKVTVGTV